MNRSRSAGREWLLLLVVVALGAALRLHGLTVHSFWIDEGESHHLATAASTWNALAHTRHPPLYFYLLRSWIHVGGVGEAWLRGLSACLSCGALIAFALTARRLLARSSAVAAVGAAALYAVSSFHIWHGQELRVYAPLDLGANVAMLGAALALTGGSRRWASALIGIGTVVAAGSHYLGGLIVPSVLAVLVLFRPDGWRRLSCVSLSSGLLWVPVFAFLVPAQLDAPLGYTANLSLRSLAETPVRHLITALRDLPSAVRFVPYAVGALVFFGFASTVFRAAVGRERTAQVALIFFAVPVVIALALCAVGPPNYLPRYLLVASPASVLVIAYGLARLAPRTIAIGAVVALVLSVGAITVAQKSSNLREDFRSACEAVAARWRPGDRLTVVTGTTRSFGEGAVRYYLRDREDILSNLVAPHEAAARDAGQLHVIYRRAPYATPGFRELRARVALRGPIVEGFRVSYLVSETR